MLRQRIMTAVIAVVLLLAVLYAAPPVLARTVIAALFVAAAWEWSGFLGVSTAQRWVYVGLIAVLEAGDTAELNQQLDGIADLHGVERTTSSVILETKLIR